MTKEPLQPQDKYVVRFPDGMRDRLKAEAERNNRSLNAEIVAQLIEYPALLTLSKALEYASGERVRLEAENKELREELAKVASRAELRGHLNDTLRTEMSAIKKEIELSAQKNSELSEMVSWIYNLMRRAEKQKADD